MAEVIVDALESAQPDLVTPNNYQINRVGVTDDESGVAIFDSTLSFNSVSGASEPFAGDAHDLRIVDTQHTDYHFRFWVFPSTIVLSNPLLDTDIPFDVWNTFGSIQLLTSIGAVGSSVLSFDQTPAVDSINDMQIETFNMQIAAGEDTIEATVTFVYPLGELTFDVFANIASVFNIIPDIPVRETWEFSTDVLTAYDGSEQRISLRTSPRRDMDFTVAIEDSAARRQQYALLMENLNVPTSIPAYAHSTLITQASSIGATRIFFDASLTQMRVGEDLAIINPQTENVQVLEVTVLYTDGADLGASLSEAITPAFYVYPSHSMILRERSGINMNPITGSLNIKAEGDSQPTLPRPGASVTIQTIDGFNIMDRRPLAPADELGQSRKQVLDYDTGGKTILNKADPHIKIVGTRRWVIKRYANPGDEDFMRQFIHDAQGAQKAWLLPTWFADLTISANDPPTGGNGQILVNELNYISQFFPYETWKHIQIEYDNLDPSYHTVTSASVTGADLVELGLSPALPNDPEVGNVKTISFLLKVRGGDIIRRQHASQDTIYTWAVETTDDG